PALEDRPERALIGAVAEQTFVILQFDVVTVDFHLREGRRRHAPQRSAQSCPDRPFIGSHGKSMTTGKAQRFRLAGQTGTLGATIRRTISIARRMSVSEASSVRKAAWEVSVTLSMRASG